MLSPAQWQAAGSAASLRQQRLFYRDSAGDAPCVLLLHGFPTSSYDWQHLWPLLAARVRLVAPDLLGFGFSAKPHPHRYSIHEQADLVEALLEHLGIDRCHLLAHDYGDTVAQELLARDNARAPGQRHYPSCSLLNGGLFPETHRARTIQKLLLSPIGPLVNRLSGRGSFGRSFSAVFGPHTRPDEQELDAFWSIILHDGGKRVFSDLIGYMRERREHRQRWVDALTDFAGPLQLINGSLDPVSGAHMVRRFREVVAPERSEPGDVIVELPQIGHYPQWEDAEAVAAAYVSFLDSQQGAEPSS
jgi:pimeloyl-ACP methyl ester carboxylesterase